MSSWEKVLDGLGTEFYRLFESMLQAVDELSKASVPVPLNMKELPATQEARRSLSLANKIKEHDMNIELHLEQLKELPIVSVDEVQQIIADNHSAQIKGWEEKLTRRQAKKSKMEDVYRDLMRTKLQLDQEHNVLLQAINPEGGRNQL